MQYFVGDNMLIFTGRFQPFHNGHLYLLDKLRKIYPNETICLAIVKDFKVSTKTSFDILANTALSKERSVLSAEDTLKLIQKVIRLRQYENVISTLMPRASDESWHIIDSMFDSNRTWVFTKRTDGVDDWEKTKMEYYCSKGEKAVMIPISKDLSGTDIRIKLKRKMTSELSNYIPVEIFEDFMRIIK